MNIERQFLEALERLRRASPRVNKGVAFRRLLTSPFVIAAALLRFYWRTAPDVPALVKAWRYRRDQERWQAAQSKQALETARRDYYMHRPNSKPLE